MKRRTFVKGSAGAIVLGGVPAVAAADATPAKDPVAPKAIVGGTLWTGNGEVVADATIQLAGERIAAVSKGTTGLDGAQIIDAKGTIVTPGFVAVGNTVGLIEIELEPSTDDAGSDVAAAIRPAFAAYDGYNPESSLIPVARLEGVTSVVPFPDGGLVSGTGAWFDLGRGTATDLCAKPYAAVRVNLANRGVEAGGGARPEAFARFRELLEDARLYGRLRSSYDKGQMRSSRASRLDLERMQDVLGGKLPLVVEVARAADILRVIDIAKAYRLKLVLFGAEEGWTIAESIAKAEVPVVVRPLTNLPEQFDRLRSRYENAALLDAAGVRVVIATPGPHDARHLRQQVGNALGWGFGEGKAVGAVTLEAAKLFGLERDYGTVERGRMANVVVWTGGSPFDAGGWATQVIVRGEAMPMRSRQTALFERYRKLPTAK